MFIVTICLLAVLGIAVYYLTGFIYKHMRMPQSRFLRIAGRFKQYQPKLTVVFVLLFLTCVIWSTVEYYPLYSFKIAAEPIFKAQPQFWVTVILTGVAFVLTQVLLFYFAYRFRSSKTNKARFFPDSPRLELLWTIVPAVSFIGLFIWSQTLWMDAMTMRSNALEIEIVAEQFNWKVRYPGADRMLGQTSFRLISNENPFGVDPQDLHGGDDFVPLQMHVPKGQAVKLVLRSKDVIHSFYIPSFRIKMDAVPGMYTRMQFTPLYTTTEMRESLNDPDFNYEVACAELCGRMHFAMKLLLIVDEPAEFDQWYDKQVPWTSHLSKP